MSRILVVDDSRLARRFVTTPLRNAGHEVIEAKNGQEGLATFREHTFDCIVSDLLMPVMDGPTFVGHVRGESEIPVIVISADVQDSTRDLMNQLRVTRFLNKPFKANELLEAVSTSLEGVEAAK